MHQKPSSSGVRLAETGAESPAVGQIPDGIYLHVTVVEPDAMRMDYFCTLGSYRMMVPPRKGEILLCQPALSAGYERYVVREVVYHLPARGIDNVVENAVTLLVVRHQTRRDEGAALGFLTRKANQQPAEPEAPAAPPA